MKGQHEPLTAILITGILVAVVGSTYFFGVPLIEKNKDVSLLDDTEKFMRSLNEKIKYVANHGGRDELKITVPAIVFFDGDTIKTSLRTTGSIYSTESLIPLGRNSCTLAEGKWGIDEPELLCVMSNCISESGEGCTGYNTTYELSYIPLVVYSPDGNTVLNSYELELVGNRKKGGMDHSILIENIGNIESPDGTLINTQVSINII